MSPAILKSLRQMSLEDYERIEAEAEEILALAKRGRSMVRAFLEGVQMDAALGAEHALQGRIDNAATNILSAVTLVQSGAALAAAATSLERSLERAP